MMTEREIRVEALTRVEGEGGLYLRLAEDQLLELQLNIFEPPRLFEALLRGRRLEEVPDITARICGICPVAYQMSSVHALERALQVQVTPELRRLRRLLYCGEWIESHTLHIHLLQAPDFLGFEDGIRMAEVYPEAVERGLRLKKHGNELLEALGGRAIHPINVAVGGFYRAPRREELQKLIPDFEWGLQAAVETTRWVAGFDFPDFERPYTMFSLVHPDEYPMNEGDVVSSRSDVIPIGEFESSFVEQQVAHSTALHSRWRKSNEHYLVGPLARVNLNRDRLSPTARRVAEEVGWTEPCLNPFRSIVARGLEVIHAYEEAVEMLHTYRPPASARIDYRPVAGVGEAVTEAPRGLLYHRYEIDERGLIVQAKIVPPTSQNQSQIEDDLRHYVRQLLPAGDDQLAEACQRLVRSYDPCISCSTHFMQVRIQRDCAGER